jgi:hypothetical protein
MKLTFGYYSDITQRAPKQALDEATVRPGTDSKVLVMPYGAVTHPVP